MELGIDARIEQIKAEEQKVGEDFFAGKIGVLEEVNRQHALWVERIKLQNIKYYAEFYGVNPDQVIVTADVDGVTTDVDGVSKRPIYSIK